MFSKTKTKNFADQYVKQHSIAPGVGAYKIEKADEKIGRSLFLRSKRY